MYAITGITGNVGGSVANSLLAAGRSVRAVMRDIGKGDVWAERGCEVVKADIADATSLASAFRGAEGVFVLVPPNFDPAPSFPEARATAASLKSALEKADPSKVVYLSTIGAQAGESNLLTQHTIIEQVAGTAADADYFPSTRVVRGEFSLGCRRGARERDHHELPAASG
jgi:NAD(P)H dehydrogenase (quinone)